MMYDVAVVSFAYKKYDTSEIYPVHGTAKNLDAHKVRKKPRKSFITPL